MSIFNTSLGLNVGQIILANPSLSFYQLRPSVSLAAIPKIINATPIGQIAGKSGGVSIQASYQVGDTVLYAWVQDEATDHIVGQALIIGPCPVNYTFSPTTMNTMLNGGMNAWTSGVYGIQETQLQRVPWLHDYNAAGYADFMGGDWAVHGQQSGMLVSDNFIGTRAGGASVILDAIGRRISETSLLRSVNTIGSEDDVCIYNTRIVHVSKHAGKAKDAYGTFVSEGPYGITAASEGSEGEEKDPPKFQVQSLISDALYASEENIVTGKDQVLASDQKRFDGIRTLSSVMGLSLERDSYLSRFQYVGRRLEYEEVDFDSRELADPQKVLENTEKWTKGESVKEEPEFQYKPVPAGEPEDVKEAKTVFTDDLKEHFAADGKAHIRLLPSGGISIMDAWGSEILMEGGNVQISAANNLLRVVGRDEVGVVSGASTTNAKMGIAFGAADGVVEIFGKKGASLASEGKTTIDGNELYEYGHAAAVMTGPTLQFVSKQSDAPKAGKVAGIQLLSKDAPIAIVGQSAMVHGETGASVTSTAAAVAIAGSAAVIGASGVQVTGALILKQESLDLSVPDAETGKPKSISVAGSQASFQCDGQAVIGGTMKVNDSLAVVNTVAASTVAAQNRTGSEHNGIYGSGKQSASPVNGSFISAVSKFSQKAVEKLSESFEKIKEEAIKLHRFGFKLIGDGSVCVSEPKFSALTSGGEATIATMAKDGDNKDTYIYPGDSFWNKDGAFKFPKDPKLARSVVMTSAEPEEKEREGVTSLKLSPPTAKIEGE